MRLQIHIQFLNPISLKKFLYNFTRNNQKPNGRINKIHRICKLNYASLWLKTQMSGWPGKQAGLSLTFFFFFSVFHTIKIKRHPEKFKRASNPTSCVEGLPTPVPALPQWLGHRKPASGWLVLNWLSYQKLKIQPIFIQKVECQKV